MCVECMSSIMVISFGGRVSLIHHADVFRWPCGSASLSGLEVINNQSDRINELTCSTLLLSQ